MAHSGKIVTSQFKTHLIQQMIESITEIANTSYYGFVGNHMPYDTGESIIPEITNSNKDVSVDPFRNMIFGKKLTSSDMAIMVPRHDWTGGEVYDHYDDEDGELFTKPFFVVVDESSYYHVYKCLNNANGMPSTAQPTFQDIQDEDRLFANNDDYYETSDGYQWKYMYSVDSQTFLKFSTDDYIPVMANTLVSSTAKQGSIDSIKITDHGLGYDNYIGGTFSTTDIQVNGNNYLYRVSTDANTQTGFYSNTIIHLMDGTGAGEYRRISNSYNTNTGVLIVLSNTDAGFTSTLDASTVYEISPEVAVSSDGTQTINCVARAIINSTSSNSVHRVEIIEPGLNYSYATASVLVGTNQSGVTEAKVRPIIPPQGGHGFDPSSELGGSTLCIYTKFSNTENDAISTENDFRQFGIIKDPLFSNVAITTVKLSNSAQAGYDGTFVVGETFSQFKKIKLNGTVEVVTGNSYIIGNDDPEFSECITTDFYMYVTDTVNNYHFFSRVEQIVNSTAIIVEDALPWTCNSCACYLGRLNTTGIINDVDTSTFYADKISSNILTEQLIIGHDSTAIANIVHMDIHGAYSNNLTFSTFNQLNTFQGTRTSGVFLEDEVVKQTSANVTIATAYCHSSNTSVLNVTNVTGRFDITKTIVGNESGATFEIDYKYYGDIDPTEGTIIYLQNDIAVSRADDQSEEIRVILEF